MCFGKEIDAIRTGSTLRLTMNIIFKLIREALEQARRERLVAELDERTLRDIGFEAEANARRDATRLPSYLGMY